MGPGVASFDNVKFGGCSLRIEQIRAVFLNPNGNRKKLYEYFQKLYTSALLQIRPDILELV